MSMPMRYGIHAPLEEAADNLLRQSMQGIRHADHDILTKWKLADRKKHEISPSEGFADGAVRRGNYWRAYNPAKPELNSREGSSPARTMTNSGRFWSDSFDGFQDAESTERGLPE
jgi:hypothetical protein